MRKLRRDIILSCAALFAFISSGCGNTATTGSDAASEATTTTTAAELSAEASESSGTTTTTVNEPDIPEQTTASTATTVEEKSEAPEETAKAESIVPDDIEMSEIDKELFEKYITENGLNGHFVKKAEVTSNFYFVLSDSFLSDRFEYIHVDKSVYYFCPIEESEEYVSDKQRMFLTDIGIKYIAGRHWRDDELDQVEAGLGFIPLSCSISWEDEWPDEYFGEYVYVLD